MTHRRSAAAAVAALLAAAALAVSACGGSAATPEVVYITPSPSPTPRVTPTPGPTRAPTPTPAPTPEPTVGASWPAVPTVVDTILSEGGSTATCSTWIVTMHKPIVTGIASPAAMNAAITALVDGYVADFKSKLASASGGGQCTLEGSFTVGIATQTLIGISFSNDLALGDAGTTTVGSLNFVSPTGEKIELADLFTDSAAAAKILSDQSRALLKATLSITADQSLVAAGTGPDLSNFDKAWVLTTDGVQLTFAQGQVGPAALGEPTITVPWSALNGVLRPTGPAGQFYTAPQSSPTGA